MFVSKVMSPRRLVAGGLLAAVVVAGTAFAADNNVEDSYAGDGSGTVSGYDITDIDYNLAPSNPANIASVSFTTSPAVGDAEVRVSFDGGTNWLPAANCVDAGAVVTCTPASTVTVLSVTSLRIVIAD